MRGVIVQLCVQLCACRVHERCTSSSGTKPSRRYATADFLVDGSELCQQDRTVQIVRLFAFHANATGYIVSRRNSTPIKRASRPARLAQFFSCTRRFERRVACSNTYAVPRYY